MHASLLIYAIIGFTTTAAADVDGRFSRYPLPPSARATCLTRSVSLTKYSGISTPVNFSTVQLYYTQRLIWSWRLRDSLCCHLGKRLLRLIHHRTRLAEPHYPVMHRLQNAGQAQPLMKRPLRAKPSHNLHPETIEHTEADMIDLRRRALSYPISCCVQDCAGTCCIRSGSQVYTDLDTSPIRKPITHQS
jgi:hypothetical protein